MRRPDDSRAKWGTRLRDSELVSAFSTLSKAYGTVVPSPDPHKHPQPTCLCTMVIVHPKDDGFAEPQSPVPTLIADDGSVRSMETVSTCCGIAPLYAEVSFKPPPATPPEGPPVTGVWVHHPDIPLAVFPSFPELAHGMPPPVLHWAPVNAIAPFSPASPPPRVHTDVMTGSGSPLPDVLPLPAVAMASVDRRAIGWVTSVMSLNGARVGVVSLGLVTSILVVVMVIAICLKVAHVV